MAAPSSWLITEQLYLGEEIAKVKQGNLMMGHFILDGKQGVPSTAKARRPGVEALPITDIIKNIALVFSCEEQDLQYLKHESVWHLVCIHSFIHSTKILGTCYVPGTRLGSGDTGA